MLTHSSRKYGPPARPRAAGAGRLLLLCLLPALLAGCAAGLTRSLNSSVSKAILNQDDPATVRAGAPAYLLLLDGLIQGSPDDPALLRSAAELYGAYATVFVNDKHRARRLSEKALEYARRSLCTDHPDVCAKSSGTFEEFAATLKDMSKSDVPRLYTLGAAWAGWVQSRTDNWQALADIAKIEAIMQRVVQLNEKYEHGRAHLYLGVFHSRLPPSMGGKPEKGREQFKKAIAISGGRDLIDKVEYARRYARLVFNKKLYDRLLHEVLDADPKAPGLTLSNVIAQRQARKLLADSADYFGD